MTTAKSKTSYTPRFSNPRTEIHPFDEVEWKTVTAEITGDDGKSIFRQENVEVPVAWSPLAVKVVVSKYFYGQLGKPERETSIKQLISRVAKTMARWSQDSGLFDEDSATAFYNDLCWLLLHQHASFNSPVWFNVGLYHQYGVGMDTQGNYYWDTKTNQVKRAGSQYEYPQCSACFIQSVDDNMESIMGLALSEAMLFKFGSGTGTDLTPIRSSRERLSGGGRPSGPLSFLKVYDQVANVVKSGGKTRRAAKMNTLRDWHGDIEEFIDAKQIEEKKAWALIEQGYDGSFNGAAYGSVMYQNENLSVRVSDEFMHAAVNGKEWTTRSVTTGKPLEKKDAGKLLHKIAEGTWICGDPGMQYDSTIQNWHTCSSTDDIHSTNPCSEYLFLNNTSCNLASINLMKFREADGKFNTERFQDAVRVLIIAQELLFDNSSYPTPAIAANTHMFRTIGLGYANLGSLVMSYGLPYDSDAGRELAGAITALMTGTAYDMSARLASVLGPFKGLDNAAAFYDSARIKPKAVSNRASMNKVISQHRAAANRITSVQFGYIVEAAKSVWDSAEAGGIQHGYRNAQVTVLAPTGTISFMMDCDTTGIEPDIALVKYKLLAGGGNLKIVNNTVALALRSLGYESDQIRSIIKWIETHDTIENCPDLMDKDLPVFDCAFRPEKGVRSIHYMAHLRMMAAAQPFISGAISKTVNMPHEATVEEIKKAYIEAWKLGLKCVAIYRDGSKRSQPLTTKKNAPIEGGKSKELEAELERLKKQVTDLTGQVGKLVRRKLPETRNAINHKFSVGGHEGYFTIGLFDDGTPGELFITMSKEGSTVAGLMDTIGTLTSMAIQYGVPLETLVKKFAFTRFEPSGYTTSTEVRRASSVIDYIFRWIGYKYVPGYVTGKPVDTQDNHVQIVHATEQPKNGNHQGDLVIPAPIKARTGVLTSAFVNQSDAPSCSHCGSITVRNGACYKCNNCGESMGCS